MAQTRGALDQLLPKVCFRKGATENGKDTAHIYVLVLDEQLGMLDEY